MEGPVSYTLSLQRERNVWDPVHSREALASGCISPRGALVAFGTMEDGSGPGLFPAVRRSGTLTTASLQGDYAVRVLRCDLAGHVNEGDAGELTFDAAGSSTGGLTCNREGLVGGVSVAGDHAEDGMGRLPLKLGGSGNLPGGILAGGRVAVASGSSASGENAALFVPVRRTAGATNGLLSGRFSLAGIEHEPGTAYRGITGTFASDGDGSYGAQTGESEEGVVVPASDIALGVYTLSANGHLHRNTPGGPMEGSVAAGGGFAVLGGCTTDCRYPSLFVLFR